MNIFEELMRDMPFAPGTVVHVEQPEVFGIAQHVTIVDVAGYQQYRVEDRNGNTAIVNHRRCRHIPNVDGRLAGALGI